MLSYLMLIPLIATCAYCVIADSGKQDDNQVSKTGNYSTVGVSFAGKSEALFFRFYYESTCSKVSY